jgi:hypothetical protein
MEESPPAQQSTSQNLECPTPAPGNSVYFSSPAISSNGIVGSEELDTVYSGGEFSDSVTINGIQFSSNGPLDAYVTAYDSSHNYKWESVFGSNSEDAVTDVAMDEEGDLYAVGYFEGEVQGEDGLNNSFSFSSTTKGRRSFVAKFDSSGMFEWVEILEGTDMNAATGVTVARSGTTGTEAVFVSGEFDGGMAHERVDVTSNGGTDAYLWSLSINGSLNFLDGYGGEGDDVANDVATHGEFVGLTGAFEYEADFGSGTLVSHGQEDVVVAIYELNGQPYSSNDAGGPYEDEGFGIVLNSESVVVTGRYREEIEFDDEVLQHSSNSATAFAAKWNYANPLGITGAWGFSDGTGRVHTGWDIDFDPCGDVYVTISSRHATQPEDLHLIAVDIANQTETGLLTRAGKAQIGFPPQNTSLEVGNALDVLAQPNALIWTGEEPVGGSGAFTQLP